MVTITDNNFLLSTDNKTTNTAIPFNKLDAGNQI